VKDVNTLRYHLNHADVSATNYIRAKHVELADAIADRHKIYLDTCYWSHFRDVARGWPTAPALVSLLVAIRDAVAAKRAICPLSQESFSEVFTHSDPKTLEATVTLIDELSESSCLTEFMQRMNTEAYHFMIQKTKGDGSVYNLDQLMWTKCGYVLGAVAPHVQDLPEELAVAMHKAFFDQMWATTLGDMFARLGCRPDWRHETDVVKHMNEDKLRYENDFNSFKQVFLIELRGILDTLEPTFAHIMAQMDLKETGKLLSDSDREIGPAVRRMVGKIYDAFRLNKIRDELPTLRVHATLHAALRWDRNRKYKVNDLADLRHAAMALPYCDLFLTEGPLCHLVNASQSRLNEYFTCRTISDASEALEHLRSIGI